MNKIIENIYAHCDGPCGHYETDTLKHGAQTCLKLAKKILDKKDCQHFYVRLVMLKEEHAQLCKNQIYILWSDFFKAKHYEQYDNLHNQLYLMAQQASLIKQSVDLDIINDFIDKIEALDKIFKEVQAQS